MADAAAIASMPDGPSAPAVADKYDRQLRLWGAGGQRRLAETCVVLVGASAAGTETLKNLVLPGAGGFVVVDDVAVAGAADMTSNFFLAQDDTATGDGDAMAEDDDGHGITPNKPRAQVAAEQLQELNPDVRGAWRCAPSLQGEDYAGLFAALLGGAMEGEGTTWHPAGAASPSTAGPTFARLLVVAADTAPPVVRAVADACQASRVPLLVVHSYGLIGAVRLWSPPVPLWHGAGGSGAVGTRPPDLRLTRPFPALRAAAAAVNWAILSDYEHGHVPYPLILLGALDDWRRETAPTDTDAGMDARLPRSPADKQQLVAIVRNRARSMDRELNFQEAVRFVHLAYASADAVAVLDAERTEALKAECLTPAAGPGGRRLARLLEVLQEFAARHGGEVPLQGGGGLPDMAASTEQYVALQTLYVNQFAAQLQELREILAATDGAEANELAISEDELTAACRNVHALALYGPRSVLDEYSWDLPVPESVCQSLQEAAADIADDDERPDQAGLLWYMGLQACHLFHQRHGRYPGTVVPPEADADPYMQDVPGLQECLRDVVQRYGLAECVLVRDMLLARGADYATELARYGNAELHTVASVVGGVAAQEAVKLLTGQYEPIDNAYIYNGIASTGGVYRF